MNISDNIIVAIITGVCTVIGDRIVMRKSEQQKELKLIERLQNFEDRLTVVEKLNSISDNLEKKLNSFENKLTAIQKDVEYLKGRKNS